MGGVRNRARRRCTNGYLFFLLIFQGFARNAFYSLAPGADCFLSCEKLGFRQSDDLVTELRALAPRMWNDWGQLYANPTSTHVHWPDISGSG